MRIAQVIDEAVPVVPDYARWVAEEQRRKREDENRRRMTADDGATKPVMGNADRDTWAGRTPFP